MEKVISAILISAAIFAGAAAALSEHMPKDSHAVYFSAGINGDYSDMFEHNRKMMDNIREYGDAYCSGYVSTKKDREVHEKILAELKTLSDSICEGEKTDLGKVKKIEYWVADNIYYNKVAAKDSVTADTISLENVLETRVTTCAGYANLFSALCDMQGIYCVNMRGGTCKVTDTSKTLWGMPMNHEWNAVRVGNKWYYVDTVWLSNNRYTENGYERSDTVDTQYIGMTFEEMCYEHRIDLIDYRDFKSSINVFG